MRGMKIDRESKKPEDMSRAKQVRMLIDRASNRRSDSHETHVRPKRSTRREKLFTPM